MHTPGPWTIEYEDEDGEPYENGVVIESPEGPVAFDVIDCSAPLIAAAPDLLRELKMCVDFYGPMAVMDDEATASHDRVILNAMAAIAKAEGRD